MWYYVNLYRKPCGRTYLGQFTVMRDTVRLRAAAIVTKFDHTLIGTYKVKPRNGYEIKNGLLKQTGKSSYV